MQARNVPGPLIKLAIMALGDGWTEKDRVGYSSKDKTLLKYFSKLVEKLTGKRTKISKGDRAFRVVVYSTNLVEKLKQLSPTFRTKAYKSNEKIDKYKPLIFEGIKYPPAKIPEIVFQLPKNEIIEILRLIFSMEGGITIYARKSKENYFGVERKVFLSCAHPTLIQQYINLVHIILPEIKIVYERRSRNLYIKDSYGIKRFKEEIGFLSGVKVSLSTSRWYKFEKNKLLQLALWVSKQPKGFWKKFKSKKELNNYLFKVLTHAKTFQ